MITFGTKAETLQNIYNKLEYAKVLPQITIDYEEWKNNQESVMRRIEDKKWINSKSVIVRSSALNEDNDKLSLAGKFNSYITADFSEVPAKINKVFNMFDNTVNNQVFIQPYLENINISGVAFSKNPNTGGDQIVINYDDFSGKTDTVTSGVTNEIKTFYFFKEHNKLPHNFLKEIILLIYELERLFCTDRLDIEFAFNENDELFLLQVRPLNVEEGGNRKDQKETLLKIYNKIDSLNSQHPYLYGEKTIFGVMPDWNPAEIIGVRPRNLALTLYKEIITDNIWAYQRDNYGYKNLRSFPLMYSFGGLPYIDVRVSFNSFLPKDLNGELSEKMVNYYIERLTEHPSNHDKVEFEIVYSCYTLDLKDRLQILKEYGFNKDELNEIEDSLRNLTNKIINNKEGLWKRDIQKIEELEERYKIIANSSLDKIDKIYWLLEDCKRYGTLPFAGLARAGFIAIQLLNSLVTVGVITHKEYESFMSGLNTINSQMQNDLAKLTKNAFLKKYGHLRPGTYDILSYRYDEKPAKYFNWKNPGREADFNLESLDDQFQLSLKQLNKLKELLLEHELKHEVLSFFEFIKKAIEGREYAKFVFTKSVSEVLSLIKELAQEEGFTLQEASYLDIADVKKLYTTSRSITQVFNKSLKEGKRIFDISKQINLPPLIMEPEDVWSFHKPKLSPNYITQKKTSGKIRFIEESIEKINGSILLIPNADPGFDWIFSHDIIGFITMYGGINSHMAIRAGELGLPAVIGVGETLYNQLKESNSIEIDCGNKQLRVLN